MDDTNFGGPLQEVAESLKNYFDQQIHYQKLKLGKKMGEVSAYVTLFFIIGFLSTLALIFLSFAFVWWYAGTHAGEMFIGYLIVTAFYALLIVLIYLLRFKIIFNPIRKLLGSILYDKEDDDHADTIHFSSFELLNHKIHKSREALNEQENVLKEQLSGLGEAYTFTSISQRLIKNAYQSVMTTSNVARFTYLLVQRIKGGKKKKRKKEPPQIEEENQ
jgi:hypothetical protein